MARRSPTRRPRIRRRRCASVIRQSSRPASAGGSNGLPAEPARRIFDLGDDVSPEAASALLAHLDVHWLQAPRGGRRTDEVPGDRTRRRRHGGRLLPRWRARVRPARPARARQRESGQVPADRRRHRREFDRRREEAERSSPWEKWYGAVEWREASVKHPGVSSYEWFLDQLVVVRYDGRVRLGYVYTASCRTGRGRNRALDAIVGRRPDDLFDPDGQPGPDRRAAGTGAAPRRFAGGAVDPGDLTARIQSRTHHAHGTRQQRAACAPAPRIPARRGFRARRVRAPQKWRRLKQQARSTLVVTCRKLAAVMVNRLAGASSPYLRQHAANPVDWYPWGEEAFALARREPAPNRSSCRSATHLPLVSRDGARIVRGFENRRSDERVVRQHQGRSRGASDLDQIYQSAHALLTRRTGSCWCRPPRGRSRS